MREEDWLSWQDPTTLLTALGRGEPVAHSTMKALGLLTISDRKLRLFACACWQAMWTSLIPGYRLSPSQVDNSVWTVMDQAERHADGLTHKYTHAYWITAEEAIGAARRAIEVSQPQVTLATMADYLRELVVNPFRPILLPHEHQDCPKCHGKKTRKGKHGRRKLCRYCLGTGKFHPYLTSQTLAIAVSIYEEKRWTELPILADALEDAGLESTCQRQLDHLTEELNDCQCDDVHGPECVNCTANLRQLRDIEHVPDLLTHLRTGTDHIRGCWALDLILGKE